MSNSASVSFSLRRAGRRDLVRDRLLERAARHRAAQRIVQARREQALALGDDPAMARQPRQLARQPRRDRLEIGALGGREPAPGVRDDRDQAGDLGRRRAQRIGDHRARLGRRRRSPCRRARRRSARRPRSARDSPRSGAARDRGRHHLRAVLPPHDAVVRGEALGDRAQRLGRGAGEIDERRRDQAARAREIEVGRRRIGCARSPSSASADDRRRAARRRRSRSRRHRRRAPRSRRRRRSSAARRAAGAGRGRLATAGATSSPSRPLVASAAVTASSSMSACSAAPRDRRSVDERGRRSPGASQPRPIIAACRRKREHARCTVR